MTNKEQKSVVENEGRRKFVKDSATVILGGIAVVAAGGISPVLAEGPGFKRLSDAVSRKASAGVSVLDWNCQSPGYTVNGKPCISGYTCSPGSSVACTLTFSCTDGSDPAYGCTTRTFTCGGMDNHTFACQHLYNCTPNSHNCEPGDGGYTCTANVNENYTPPQE